jgi:hypothetical protein
MNIAPELRIGREADWHRGGRQRGRTARCSVPAGNQIGNIRFVHAFPVPLVIQTAAEQVNNQHADDRD